MHRRKIIALHILQEFCKKNPKRFTTDFATNFAMNFSTDFAIYVQNSNQFATIFAKQFAKYYVKILKCEILYIPKKKYATKTARILQTFCNYTFCINFCTSDHVKSPLHTSVLYLVWKFAGFFVACFSWDNHNGMKWLENLTWDRKNYLPTVFSI